MEGMTVVKPKPEPIRHSRKFDTEEIKQALRFYLNANGVEIPKGREYLHGLDCDANGDDKQLLFVVEEIHDAPK